MKRCFVGLALPPDTRQALQPLLDDLAQCQVHHAQIRPVAERNLHCTLKFLGDVTDEQLRRLDADLAELAAGASPCRAETIGIGTFGAPRPRAIYARIGHGQDSVVALADAVERCCEGLGFPREGRVRVPHVTLARVSGTRDPRFDPQVITAWAHPHLDTAFGLLDGTGFHLYQSATSADGSVYTSLRAFMFGSA